MADSTIRFKIASSFAGEGFTKLNQGVQDMASNAGKAVTAGQKITGALSGIGGITGKVASGCNAVITSFKSLGVAGGIAAVAVEGVKLWFDRALIQAEKLRDKCKELAEVMREKLGKQVNGILGDMKDNLDAVGTKADRDAQSLDKVADAARRVNAAMGKTESAKEAAEAVNVKLETLNNKLAAENENAADLAEAEGDVKLAQVEKKNAVNEHARIVKAAKDAEEEANDKLTTAQTNLINAKNALKDLTDKEKLLIDSGLEDEAALNTARKNVEAAESLVKTREDELVTATANVTVKHLETEEALIEEKSAIAEHEGAEREATEKLKSLKEKIAQEEEASTKAFWTRLDLEAAQRTYKEQEERRSVLIESAEQNRKDALERLADAHEQYEKWEQEAATMTKDKYTKLQQINLQKLSDAFDRAPKTLNEVQRQMVADYREWLAKQGDNPWKDVINQITNEIESIDAETKAHVAAVSSNMEKTSEEISNLKDALTQCLKVQ